MTLNSVGCHVFVFVPVCRISGLRSGPGSSSSQVAVDSGGIGVVDAR